MYLHELDVSSFVLFSVDLHLSLHLQIKDLFLQRLLPERSLISLPLTLPQVLLPVRQLKRNASTYFNTYKNDCLLLTHFILLYKYLDRIFIQETFYNTFLIPEDQ